MSRCWVRCCTAGWFSDSRRGLHRRLRSRRGWWTRAAHAARADPEFAVRVAVAAEEAGFESVWTGEHVAMPIRDNPVPTPPETPLLDSLVALANVAAHTRRLRLGTGILVLPHHNPVLLAKALTTLDLVSGGRLIAGFGGGGQVHFDRAGADIGQELGVTQRDAWRGT